MNDKLVGHLFNDFVAVYQAVTRCRSREKAVASINNGMCGMAALAVGNVLIERYGYSRKRVHWASHCLHMWLRVDGVDYDSLYPEGYNKPVIAEWLLEEVHYNDYEMEDPILSKEDNDGYQQFHLWFCQVINVVFYARHGVTPPDFVAKNARNWRTGVSSAEHKQQRRAQRRGKLAMALPLPDIDAPVLTNDVYPLTHYSHGEFEPEFSRVLRRRTVDLRSCSMGEWVRRYRRLIKDSIENKIPVTRL